MEKLLTVFEAAEILGLHFETVREMTRDGRLKIIKPTGERSVRIDPKDLQALIDATRKEGADDEMTMANYKKGGD